MKKEEKTNVMRVLEQKKVPYESRAYTQDATLTGEEIAGILGQDPRRVFKTLVTRGKSGQYYVFVVPVAEDLDLKKAAKASGEKSIEMIKQKELLPLTGYVHGGCSPIGMKKQYPTYIDETAVLFDKIYFAAGKRGVQIILAPEILAEFTEAEFADLTRE